MNVEKLKFRRGSQTLAVAKCGLGPPVFFLHGYPLSNRMWDTTLRKLSENFCCIAPDFRGFGESSEEISGFQMSDLAADTVWLMDQLGFTTASIVGLSMGGYVAFEIWARFADRISNLVLCDTRAGVDTPEAAAARWKASEQVLEVGTRKIVEPMIARLIGERTRDQLPDVVANLEAMMFQTRPSTIAWAQQAMAQRRDFTELLPSIQTRTLLVVGEHDVISTAREMKSIASAIPKAKLEIILDSGHMPPMECPDAFSDVLQSWLLGS